MSFISLLIIIELLFNCVSAFETDKIEFQSTSLHKKGKSLLLPGKQENRRNPIIKVTETENSQTERFIRGFKKRSTPYQFNENLGYQFIIREVPFAAQNYMIVPGDAQKERIILSNFLSRQLRQRPSFAGLTGGNFRPQLIPSGTPWPSKPEQTTKRPQIADRFEETTKWKPSPGFIWNAKPFMTSTFPPLVRPPINSISEGSNKPSKPSQTNRPSNPQKTTSNPHIVDRFQETTEFPFTEIIITPTRPRPNRPFFAGETGGNYYPQLIPPGKPWPARPEDYTTFSVISNNLQPHTKTAATIDPTKSEPLSTISIEPGNYDIINKNTSTETSTILFEDRFEEIPSNTPTRPPPNRPPFAGETGGNFKPQIVPPGKPLPSKPQENTSKETTSKPFEDRFEEIFSSVPTRPPPNRPSFAGETGGNFKPQIVTPGSTVLSRPQENTSKETIAVPFEDRFEEVSSNPTRPPSNRPPFAGETGGNFRPQIVPPGKPLPSKPQEVTCNETTVEPFEDKFEEVPSRPPTRPPPNRPSFAGETGGNFRPQIIPPGTPWPSKPKSTSKETTAKTFEEITSVAPTGGKFRPQIISSGKPLVVTTKSQVPKNKKQTQQTTPLSLMNSAHKDEITTVEDFTSGAPFTSRPIAINKV